MNKFTFKQAWIVHKSFIKEDKTLKKKNLGNKLIQICKNQPGISEKKRQFSNKFANHRKLE